MFDRHRVAAFSKADIAYLTETFMWRYKTRNFDLDGAEPLEYYLIEAGQDGWELVSVIACRRSRTC